MKSRYPTPREKQVLKAGLRRCSCAVHRYGTRPMGQILRVAGDCNKLASTTQLTLQLKNSLVVVVARDPWRQVINQHAHTPLRSHCQRRHFQHVLQAMCRKKPHSPTVNSLTAEWAQESLYGGRERAFLAQNPQKMLKEGSLAMNAGRGGGGVGGYFPPPGSPT